MILNPISIATRGIYAGSVAISLATFGYVDISGAVEAEAPLAGWNQTQINEEDDIQCIVQAIMLIMRKL